MNQKTRPITKNELGEAQVVATTAAGEAIYQTNPNQCQEFNPEEYINEK